MNAKKNMFSINSMPWPLIGAVVVFLAFVVVAQVFGK